MKKCVIVKTWMVRDTLEKLQEAGRQRSECVVLWLGTRTVGGIIVSRTWKPEQIADPDSFYIPEESMDQLMQFLRNERLMIAAQVHSHPRLAFHSWADDDWAIVRHVGALSIVLPHFALRTEDNSFVRDAAVFRLSPENEWLRVPEHKLKDFYRIEP